MNQRIAGKRNPGDVFNKTADKFHRVLLGAENDIREPEKLYIILNSHVSVYDIKYLELFGMRIYVKMGPVIDLENHVEGVRDLLLLIYIENSV